MGAICSARPATDQVDLLRGLRRGALAGLIGGATAGAFGFLLAEPVMDRAVRLEAARQAAAGEHSAELFDRHTQHLGFLVATTATGVALGVLLGVLLTVLHPSDPDREPWGRAVRLGAAAWFGVYLVPFLRYPANPPGVGDPATIGLRTNSYLSAVVLGLVGAVVAVLVARRLGGRGAPVLQLSVVGVLIATVALTFVLPGNPDALAVPAALLWQFRLLALATSTLLWGGLAASYGLLGERSNARSGAREPVAV